MIILDITPEQKEKYFTKKSKNGVIYKITNIINGDFYIGSSCNFFKRYYTHVNHIKTNKQSCTLLVRAANKYGEENFKIEIIEECLNDQVLNKEQFYLDTLSPKYNISKIAGSNLGVKRTLEVKQKRSLIQKENWKDSQYRQHHLEKLSKNWKFGENHRMAKLTEVEVVSIKKQLALGLKPKQVSDLLGLSYHSIKDIHRGKTWKNIII
jgi:group I intron endonuclease